MDAFTQLESAAVPIDIVNCDTDQIIPARFLRRSVRDPDYPSFLFHDLRFEPDGTAKDFIFDRPAYRGAEIIVADRNWGCGSSRENAVTALVKNGIRCVIAPTMGDIHFNNCTKRGVLPVCLPAEVCKGLREQLHHDPGASIAVDLEACTVVGPDGITHQFEMEAFDRERLLTGLDEIELTLQYAEAIERYEGERARRFEWLSP